MIKSKSGFTIVELLIVIVVIGILAAITVIAYTGIQLRARDGERQQDIASIQKVLELYYIDKETYPNATQMLDSVWRQANLPAQGEGIYINPQDTGSTNSMTAAGSAVLINKYSYYGVKNSGGTTCLVGDICTGYRMAWKLEANPTVNQVKNVDR